MMMFGTPLPRINSFSVLSSFPTMPSSAACCLRNCSSSTFCTSSCWFGRPEVGAGEAVGQISELAEQPRAEAHAVLSAAGRAQLEQVLLDLDELLFELQCRLHDLGVVEHAARALRSAPRTISIWLTSSAAASMSRRSSVSIFDLFFDVGLGAAGVRILAHLELLRELLAADVQAHGVAARRHEDRQARRRRPGASRRGRPAPRARTAGSCAGAPPSSARRADPSRRGSAPAASARSASARPGSGHRGSTP